jgi:DNA-binding response OmpR family regulator
MCHGASRSCDAATQRHAVLRPQLPRSLGNGSCRTDRPDRSGAMPKKIALPGALPNPPGLILTDAHVPFIDGFQLCKCCGKTRATAHVPILLTTSQQGADERERARQAGANAVLIKPLEIQAFVGVVGTLVKEARVPGDQRIDASAAPGRPTMVVARRPPDNRVKDVDTQSHGNQRAAVDAAILRCPDCDRRLALRSVTCRRRLMF